MYRKPNYIIVAKDPEAVDTVTKADTKLEAECFAEWAFYAGYEHILICKVDQDC